VVRYGWGKGKEQRKFTTELHEEVTGEYAFPYRNRLAGGKWYKNILYLSVPSVVKILLPYPPPCARLDKSNRHLL
jgi:hypothetical protein